MNRGGGLSSTGTLRSLRSHRLWGGEVGKLTDFGRDGWNRMVGGGGEESIGVIGGGWLNKSKSHLQRPPRHRNPHGGGSTRDGPTEGGEGRQPREVQIFLLIGGGLPEGRSKKNLIGYPHPTNLR